MVFYDLFNSFSWVIYVDEDESRNNDEDTHEDDPPILESLRHGLFFPEGVD